MRVGLNVLHLVPRETGGGELYVRRLIPALLEAGRYLELVVFAGDEGAPSLAEERWASEVELVHVPVRTLEFERRIQPRLRLETAPERQLGPAVSADIEPVLHSACAAYNRDTLNIVDHSHSSWLVDGGGVRRQSPSSLRRTARHEDARRW